MATFLKSLRISPLFLAVFLKCGLSFAQQIQLNPPSGRVCYSQSFDLSYTFSGEFPENEIFVLVRQYTGQVADSLVETSNGSVKLSLTSTASVFLVGKKSGIQSNIVQINPDAYPGLFLQYNSSPICEGYSTPIEIYTGLLAGDQITWKKDSEVIPGAFQSTFQANTSGTYTASVQRGQCSYKVFGEALIEVGKIEKAKLSSSNTPEVCEGFHVSLSGSVPEIPDLQMQWLYEGDTIAGAATKNFSATEKGSYQLQLKQGQCTSTSDPFLVNIGHLASGKISTSPIMAENGSVTICENMNLQLISTSYSGRSDIDFYWLKDGEGIPGERVKTVSIQEPGIYRLGLKQGDCESLSEPLEVKTGPIQGIQLSDQESINICKSKSYTLIPQGQNSDVVRNTFNLSLYKDGALVRNLTQFFDLSTVTESGHYSLSGSFSRDDCPIVSDTVQLNFLEGEVPFDLFSATDNIVSCASEVVLGNEVSIPGISGSADSFQWFFNDQPLNGANQKTLSASQAGNYRLKANIDSSCVYASGPLGLSFGKLNGKIQNLNPGLCSGQLNLLRYVFDENVRNKNGELLSNSANYQWSDQNKILGTQATQTVSKSGNYKIRASVNGCEPIVDSVRIQLTEINTTLSPAVDTVGICLNGGYAVLSSNEIANSYQWVNNNLTAVSDSFSVRADRLGSYKVWIEKNGCNAFSESKYIIENVELPTATVSGGGEIEFGKSTKIQIDFTGPGPWTYTTPEGGTVTADATPHFQSVQPINSMVFSITTVENPCGFGEVFGSAEIIVVVLGLEESEKLITVYPNPVSEVLKLSTTKDFSIIEYSLTDIRGKLIEKGLYQPRGIFVSHLNPGTYLLSLLADDKRLIRKIVIL